MQSTVASRLRSSLPAGQRSLRLVLAATGDEGETGSTCQDGDSRSCHVLIAGALGEVDFLMLTQVTLVFDAQPEGDEHFVNVPCSNNF